MSDDLERSGKNQVFNPQSPPAEPPPQRSTAPVESTKAELGLDIPTEIVPLPSLGKVYTAGHPFKDKETVEIRTMTAREEDILTSQALLKQGTVITELLKSCLVTPGIDPKSLLSGDRNALMVSIRITGYGPEYKAEVQCSDCEAKTVRVFRLDQLAIKYLDIEPLESNSNLFEFKLPRSKHNVKFRFLTGADEEEMLATQQRQKKLALPSNNVVTSNLMHSIVSIGGVTDRSKLTSYIRAMPAFDSQALRSYIREHEPGIVMRQSVKCTCGHEEEVSMPMGVNFLWPSAK